MELLSQSIAGLAQGSIYALLALAINIVFSARRVINFAQGDMVMFAGFIGVTLIVGWGIPYVLGLAGAIAVVAAVALVIERVAIRPLPADENSIAWILSIIAVAIIMSNSSQIIFGTDPQQFPSPVSDQPVAWGGIRVVPQQLVAIALTALFMVGFSLAQNHTIYGKAMKAAARDPEMAAMLGISVQRYVSAAFALSGIMSVVAGFLVAPLTFVNADLGFALGLKGFAAAALGGLGTFGGAVAGGLVLGIAETLSASYLGSAVKDSVSLIILCLILLIRPVGIVGETRVIKV